jgi:glycosyltransferase involved in cell wall biosynthesis
MNLNDITALVMVKNESFFIGHVLSPLVRRLAGVIFFDTGSQDGTPEIAESLGIQVYRKGDSSPEALGKYRTEMCNLCPTPWNLIVDGDELYEDEMFDDIAEYEVPPGKIVGFTSMCSVDFVDGQYVLLQDMFSRLALHPKGTIYQGEYPFESPGSFADPSNFFYVPTRKHAYHLHRLVRSPLDEKVFMRKDKQFTFSLQNVTVPIAGPVTLPFDARFHDPFAQSRRVLENYYSD